MKKHRIVFRQLRTLAPIVGIIMLILLAGVGQTVTGRYLQAQQSQRMLAESLQRAAAYQALTGRIEEYRQAFEKRDYTALYSLSYFKGVPQPSLAEYRQLRDAGYDFDIQVIIETVELQGDKAQVNLKLELYHPRLGFNRTNHMQQWELCENLWYKVDYGN